jgi:putative holliday junction resolvase
MADSGSSERRAARRVWPRVSTPRVILAFDFGERRIGVASGDTLTRTARALVALEARGDALWKAVDALVREYEPGQLVVGLPLNMDGSATPLTDASREFCRDLNDRYHIPAALVDERLSSKEAEGRLRDARASGLKRRRTTRADVDMTAACVLLEQWLHGGASESV